MGLAKQFNDIIENQLNIFAAWLPITNSYQLGDYGILDDGVFAKMGNIKELGIDFTQGKGKDAKIDFASDSTRIINFAAGAEVDVIPEGAVEAKVTFKFEKERSFLLKSPLINVNTIENVNEIGNKLLGDPKWQKRFKVVYQTYFATEAVIISTIDAGTEISFSGDAKALQQLNVGSTSVSFSSKNKLGLNLQGADGTIGLGLFQMKRGGFLGTGKKQVEILSDDENDENDGPFEIEFLSSRDATNDL